MADVVRGYLINTDSDNLRDISSVYVSGTIALDNGNYGLLVVPATSDGVVSSTNPLSVDTDDGYTRLDTLNDLYGLNADMLKELKKMNMYLSMLLDEEVKNEEIEV